jgi:hypothetical protein
MLNAEPAQGRLNMAARAVVFRIRIGYFSDPRARSSFHPLTKLI